jgi:hypothetical protein
MTGAVPEAANQPTMDVVVVKTYFEHVAPIHRTVVKGERIKLPERWAYQRQDEGFAMVVVAAPPPQLPGVEAKEQPVKLSVEPDEEAQKVLRRAGRARNKDEVASIAAGVGLELDSGVMTRAAMMRHLTEHLA